MPFVYVNGQMLPLSQPALPVQNQGFKFGDGLFETMRLIRGRLPLEQLHCERLWAGMQKLHLLLPSLRNWQDWLQQIAALANANNCLEHGRVRLTIFRDESSYGYTLEATPLQPSYQQWNIAGERLVIFPEGRKAMDAFSNIKSTSYQLYAMTALFAHNNNADDAIVLNTEGNICDTSRANLFIVKDGNVFTPALSQGCVAGVMRRWIIDCLIKTGYSVTETTLTEADLLQADEIFLTNALYGIRWVSCFGDKHYTSHFSHKFYEQWLPTIFS